MEILNLANKIPAILVVHTNILSLLNYSVFVYVSIDAKFSKVHCIYNILFSIS